MIKYIIITEDIVNGEGIKVFKRGYAYELLGNVMVNGEGDYMNIQYLTEGFRVEVDKSYLH